MIETILIILGVIGFFSAIGFVISIFEKLSNFVYRLAAETPARSDKAIHSAKKEIEGLVSQFQIEQPAEQQSIETKVAKQHSPKMPSIKPMVEMVGDVELGSEEATEMMSIRIGNKAVVMARYYAASKTVARHLAFNDKKLTQRLGKRMAMSPLKVNGNWLHGKFEVIRATRKEVNELISEYQNGLQDIARQPKSPPTVKSEVTSKNPDRPIPQQASSEPVDKQAREMAKAVFRGKLQWHGLSERVHGDKTFKHYRLDYIDDDTQLLETVWGEDLKRAITSCSAQTGDTIEILRLAKKRIDSDQDKGEKRFMNRFHILILKKA